MWHSGRLDGYSVVIGQEIDHSRDPLIDLVAERSPMFGAGGLNIFESNGLARMLRADRPAEKMMAVKHADFTEVTWIVPSI
jgi:hypothetical protein